VGIGWILKAVRIVLAAHITAGAIEQLEHGGDV
jgi:hypothetical protein